MTNEQMIERRIEAMHRLARIYKRRGLVALAREWDDIASHEMAVHLGHAPSACACRYVHSVRELGEISPVY